MLHYPSLVKLFTHVEPARLVAWVFFVTGEEPPETVWRKHSEDQRKAVRATRFFVRRWLMSLSKNTLDRLEFEAEQIISLTDRIGVEVLAGIRFLLRPEQRAAFEAQHDQFERALWLAQYDAVGFEQALQAREAESLRGKARAWSGFLAPTGLHAVQDIDSRARLMAAIARLLGLGEDQVAVQVFLRLRAHSRLIQVSAHYNRPTELVDQVSAGHLTHAALVRALAAYVTYDPDTGALEVLSPEPQHREAMARIVADTLLECAFDPEPIPLRHFDYQRLAKPMQLDISSEPDLFSATVVSLGYVHGAAQLHFSIGSKARGSIYDVAAACIADGFCFGRHLLNSAKIRLQLRPTLKRRARSLTIHLADSHRCNIKSMSEADRALCERLLRRWGITHEVGCEAFREDNAFAA